MIAVTRTNINGCAVVFRSYTLGQCRICISSECTYTSKNFHSSGTCSLKTYITIAETEKKPSKGRIKLVQGLRCFFRTTIAINVLKEQGPAYPNRECFGCEDCNSSTTVFTVRTGGMPREGDDDIDEVLLFFIGPEFSALGASRKKPHLSKVILLHW